MILNFLFNTDYRQVRWTQEATSKTIILGTWEVDGKINSTIYYNTLSVNGHRISKNRK